MKTIEATVFPSEENTIFVQEDDVYGGAHLYHIDNCKGYNNGQTEYGEGNQPIQFIHKADDGTITPGLQSEQVVLMLKDRHGKLNSRFPSPQHEKMMAGFDMFLEACKERVESRIKAGVMGELKNLPDEGAAAGSGESNTVVNDSTSTEETN